MSVLATHQVTGAPAVPRPRGRAAAELDAAVDAVVREVRHRGATTEDDLQVRPALDELPHDRIRAALVAACERGLLVRSCRGDYDALTD